MTDIVAIFGLLCIIGLFTVALMAIWRLIQDQKAFNEERRLLTEFASKVAEWDDRPPVTRSVAQEKLAEAERIMAACQGYDEALTRAARAGVHTSPWRRAASAQWMTMARTNLHAARRACIVADAMACIEQNPYGANRHG